MYAHVLNRTPGDRASIYFNSCIMYDSWDSNCHIVLWTQTIKLINSTKFYKIGKKARRYLAKKSDQECDDNETNGGVGVKNLAPERGLVQKGAFLGRQLLEVVFLGLLRYSANKVRPVATLAHLLRRLAVRGCNLLTCTWKARYFNWITCYSYPAG